MNIVERNTFFDNFNMWQQCEGLKRIITKTEQVKSGRGKSIKLIDVPKYETPPEIVEKIFNSCEYYKKLYQNQMDRKFKYRDYQEEIIKRGANILRTHRFLYLAMEVRTGKTLTSLGIAELMYPKNVLFVTKKKAISSIEADYAMMNPEYHMTIINYESLHLVMGDKKWDILICDEAHSMGAFPKPSGRAELVGEIILKVNPMVILLSGTPTPESYSQIYHQVYKIPKNPFSQFKNFYRFADVFVKVKQRKVNGLLVNDYSEGLDSILESIKQYTINYTQKEAGFNAETTEEILEVELKESTYRLISKLKKDLVIEGKSEVILADTPAKLMMKVHQLCSGTIKFESGNSMIVDKTKAEFIKEYFDGCKIAIFYKFKEELNALQEVFGDNLTTELPVFEDTDKNIALQIVSGREGISLKMADYLVYYNIDFSATSYWQSKDRMTTKERLQNNVYWVFSKGGIEKDIYKAVIKKKDYTINHFKNT